MFQQDTTVHKTTYVPEQQSISGALGGDISANTMIEKEYTLENKSLFLHILKQLKVGMTMFRVK